MMVTIGVATTPTLPSRRPLPPVKWVTSPEPWLIGAASTPQQNTISVGGCMLCVGLASRLALVSPTKTTSPQRGPLNSTVKSI